MTAEGIVHLEKVLADLEAATTAGRDLVRDLHAATKDGRALLRDIERVLRDDGAKLVDERMTAEVTRQLDALGESTRLAMDQAVEKVGKEFDRLAAIYLEGPDGGPSLHDLAMRNKSRAKPGMFVASYSDDPRAAGRAAKRSRG